MRGYSYSIQGIDISKHQGDVDFDEAKNKGGARFCVARATATGNEDPRFSEYWYGMAQAGLIRGAYAYVRPISEDPINSAVAFADVVAKAERAVFGGAPLHSGEALAPWLDLEGRDYFFPARSDNEDWVRTWIRVVQDQLERGVNIYAGSRFWKDCISEETPAPGLLIAPRYTLGDTPPSCSPWLRWSWWQWSGGGTSDYYRKKYGHPFPGAGDRSIDVDAFNGDLDELIGSCQKENDIFLGKGEGWPALSYEQWSAECNGGGDEPSENVPRAGILPEFNPAQGSRKMTRILQGLLRAAGSDLDIDGIWGPITARALEQRTGSDEWVSGSSWSILLSDEP